MASNPTRTRLSLASIVKTATSSGYAASFNTVSSSSTTQAPPLKMQKTAARDVTSTNGQKQGVKRMRMKRGMLSGLMEMPLDIMFEILGHVLPVDLLHMARTTKALRKIVFSKSSIASWRRAFDNLPPGLPPCPEDLSEPRYASLLFEKACNACPRGTGNTIEWVLRMRFCNHCLDIDFHDFGNRYDDPTDALSVLYKALVPNIEIVQGSFGEVSKHLYYKKAMITYREVMYSAVKKPENCAEIVETNTQRRAHGDLCSAWLAERRREYLNEGEQVRNGRISAIFEKLTDLGWGDEISGNRLALVRHPLVWQKKALTDRIWNNIRPKLVKFLEDKRAERAAPSEMNEFPDKPRELHESYEAQVNRFC